MVFLLPTELYKRKSVQLTFVDNMGLANLNNGLILHDRLLIETLSLEAKTADTVFKPMVTLILRQSKHLQKMY